MDKLTMLIQQLRIENKISLTDQDTVELINHLKTNGIIAPPCNVGDILYFTEDNTGHMARRVTGFTQNKILSYAMEFDMSDFGKTLFLEREAAEQVLKERQKNGKWK